MTTLPYSLSQRMDMARPGSMETRVDDSLATARPWMVDRETRAVEMVGISIGTSSQNSRSQLRRCFQYLLFYSSAAVTLIFLETKTVGL